jgi:hypothetical protein
MDFSPIFLFIFLLFAAIIILLPLLVFLRLKRAKADINRSLNASLFLVSLPRKPKAKDEREAPKNRKEIISIMEQLYSSVAHLVEKDSSFLKGKQSLVFELAIPHSGEEISFYVSSPRRWAEMVEKQIHGFYPDARIDKVKDYNIFGSNSVVKASYLKLLRDRWLPFKTYQNLEADPLNEIATALSKAQAGKDGAAFQILIRPARKTWRLKGLRIARKMMRENKVYSVARDETVFISLRKVMNLFNSIGSLSQKEEEKTKANNYAMKQLTPMQEEIIKALEGKAGKVGFETNLRLLVSSESEERAEQLISHLESAFAQFNSPTLNSFVSRRVGGGGSLRKMIYNFSFRLFDPGQTNVLNAEELTSMYHFGVASVEAPKMNFLRAKLASPPPNLPSEGLILGRNLYRGMETVVRLSEDDRRRHLYIIGQTGTGKSAFLQNMIEQDIKNGHGVAVLDPHGDLIEKILGLTPRERAEDVILCDPSDLERPMGLNMLEYDASRPEQKTFIVNELINIFDKLYDLKSTGGPMFEQYTRNALLLLMDDPAEQSTLMEVPRIMADKLYRQRLLLKCKNIIVKDFWEKEAEKAGGEAALANMVPYVTSKFNTFIANDYMRPIIGQPKSSFNFREVLDSGKILLVSLPKGRLGEINASLLGLIVVGKLVMASFARIDTPEDSRRDFHLYLDEFQNFTTESIETALSEARKYRLSLTLAHQFIGQLPEEIRDAVFGNVGSLASFRIGADDAEFIVKQFAPVFDENDLINIDNYNAYVKLLIKGATTSAFNIMTYPPAKGAVEMADNIRQLSRFKYGKERALVEADIYERLKR